MSMIYTWLKNGLMIGQQNCLTNQWLNDTQTHTHMITYTRLIVISSVTAKLNKKV